jgi:hypothetical protein
LNSKSAHVGLKIDLPSEKSGTLGLHDQGMVFPKGKKEGEKG